MNLSCVPVAATFSKDPKFWGHNFQPRYILEANGPDVKGEDGRWYTDWVSGLGAIILGRGEAVDKGGFVNHVAMWIKRGDGYSLPSSLEYSVAEKLCHISGNHVPGWSADDLQVRWVKSGSDACDAAVRLARAVTGKEAVLSCYDRDTEVLTKCGFVPIDQVTIECEIATLNRETDSLEFHRPLAVYSYDYDGEMISFQGVGTDLLVTPDHFVYVRYTNRCGERYFKLVEAKEFIGRSTCVSMLHTSINWYGDTADMISIPPAERGERVRVQDGPQITQFQTVAFARFLGWYLTDGYSIGERRAISDGRYEIGIRQKKEKNIDTICSVISDLGFTPRVSSGRVCFYSKDLWQWLQQIGKTKDKHIPVETKGLCRDALIALLDAAIDGDGTRGDDGLARKFFTTSKRLADDFQELCIKVGWRCKVSEYYNTSGFLSSSGKGSHIYHLSISRRQTGGGYVSSEHYSGPVYCVTVPNHVLMVRRSGYCTWSGNSGYHGWGSDFVSMTPPHHGVVNSEWMIPLEIGENLDAINWTEGLELAAVILEYPAYDIDPDWLSSLREYCSRVGALLIMDEVVTGLRWMPGGACERYGIKPDLICMGKALGNGLAISALIGPRKYMTWFARNDPVFVSSTHFGEIAGLAAADYVLDYVIRNPKCVDYLWSIGTALMVGLQGCGYDVFGHPPRSLLKFEDDYHKAYFIAGMRDRGYLVNRPNFPTMAHTQQDVAETVKAASEVMVEMKNQGPEGVRRSVGEDLPTVLFRNR